MNGMSMLDPESMARLRELSTRTPPPKPQVVHYAGGVGESRMRFSEWLERSEQVLAEVSAPAPKGRVDEPACGCCWRFERGEWTQVAVCVDHYTPVPTPPSGFWSQVKLGHLVGLQWPIGPGDAAR